MSDSSSSSPEISNVSLISSVPSHVCICSDDKTFHCNKFAETFSIFPGGTIEIRLITVGQRNGTSPGIINARLKSYELIDHNLLSNLEEGTARLGPGQESQMSQGVCSELRYTIFSTRKALALELSSENPTLEEFTASVVIELSDCPLGFGLTANATKCDCISFLLEKGLVCDIETQTIRREPPVWIGGESVDAIQYYVYCPFDYCRPDTVNITISDQDNQCAYNRTGVTCGMCAPGYSVIFGGNECWKCSNYYLLLIVVYAIAGLLLVFSLYFFDTLTVSAGTINGLIFYANIIQLNGVVFFPPQHNNPSRVFVAWLSLDLGIRTCFYDGMDTYAKTWLQFVFPLYIVAILVCVVIISSYSTSVSKIFTCKSVGVLATLILLFFSKLQRIVVNCLSFSTLQYSNGNSNRHWRFDGNIEYFSGKHIIISIAGILLIVFILVPFNFVLLFGKQFQALSSYRYFRWVNKLKPLFDAYMGPYKDRYRSWTGLLLLARQVLIVVTIVAPRFERILLAVVIVPQLLSIVTWFNGGIYRHWPLNVLEFSFLLNLTITSAATLFVRSIGNQPEFQTAVIDTSVSIAFLEFVVIFFYALYNRIITASCKSASFVKFQQSVLSFSRLPQKLKKAVAKESSKQKSPTHIELGPTNTVVTVDDQLVGSDFGARSVIALRESLLEHSSDL